MLKIITSSLDCVLKLVWNWRENNSIRVLEELGEQREPMFHPEFSGIWAEAQKVGVCSRSCNETQQLTSLIHADIGD